MRIEAAFLITLWASTVGAADLSKRAVAPYTWKENFQGDSLAQFASYPPVQDIGYDPSLSPSTGYGAPGGRALMRIVKPTRAGLERFGFVRALNLLTPESGRLSFQYRVDFAKAEDRIEIGIAGADGKRYAAAVPVEPGERWHAARISVAELQDADGRSAPAHTGIDAFYVVANLKHASPDITYRFLIGDLEMDAAREMPLNVGAPYAVEIAHWPERFAVDPWNGNRPMTVVVLKNLGLPLSRAECAVEDEDGRTAGTYQLQQDGMTWSASVKPPAAGGLAQLVLRGTATDGRMLSTRVRVLRRPAGTPAHPRLYFGPADRDRFVTRTRDPRFADIWRGLRERARASRGSRDLSRVSGIFALLDPDYLLATLPSYSNIVDRAGDSVQLNALDAYLTGDEEAFTSARTSLLAIANWNAWQPPWFEAHGQHTYYPAGLLTARTAFAYDLLYDRLTPNERALVRRALLRRDILPTYREYVQDNRLLADTSNWIGHTVGGALVASAAIWGDGPDGDGDLPLYTNGLLRKFENHLAASYLADGSYGEGISYQEFDLETTTLALTAVQRVLGIDYWSRSHVKDSLWYAVTTLAQPSSAVQDTGDSHPPRAQTSAPVVAHSNNPVFAWFYNQFPHGSLHDFLFADFSLATQPPPEPGSRYFPNKGYVVFRSGRGEDDAILLFRAGPNFNHNHADQGSFLLRAFGENLVREAGYAHYYQDPYYDSYFKQAIGHNTVLVDDDSESQEVADTLRFPALDQYPRMTGVLLSPSVDMATGELQQVYRGRLRAFHRHILMVRSDYVLVCDDLVANRGPSQFQWLLHLPDLANVKTAGDSAWYTGANAALAIRALLPAGASLRSQAGHIPHSVFNPAAPPAPPPNLAILEVSTKHPAAQTRFLVLLAPSRAESAARSLVSSARPIDEAGWAGFESHGDREDIVLFRKGAARLEAAYAAWSTDAAVWLARRESGRDTLLAAQSVTTLKRDGRILFACDKPVDFAADYQDGHIELTVNAPAPARARIARPDGAFAELSIAAGQQELAIR